jgi:two-component system phosphate regulon response regulator PhoB
MSTIVNCTILIVEDDPTIQCLVAVNLQLAGYRVLCTASVAEAEGQLEKTLPDLVILDWMLPDISGVMFTRRLRAKDRTRNIPIVLLSARVRECDRVTGLEAGADDYVTKPFYPRELVARVKAVMRRCAPQLIDGVVEVAGVRCDSVRRQVTGNGRDLGIKGIGFRLLRFLMTKPGRIYSRAQLVEAIWRDVCIEERTVDVHICMLRQALAATGHARLLQAVRGAGYRFTCDAPARPSAQPDMADHVKLGAHAYS